VIKIFMRRRGEAANGGFTLIELVAAVTVLGIIAAVGAPLISDMVSALFYSGGSASENLVLREAGSRISAELKGALESPDSLRPRVSSDGTVMRLYWTNDPADSIRYFFSAEGGSVFLSRTAGGSAPVKVPGYAAEEVSYLGGSFSVDGGSTGRCDSGRAEIILRASSGAGFGADTTEHIIEVYCRNFR
jgi:prepilin-type N-terminal cleavage/methylation domain-containing protein